MANPSLGLYPSYAYAIHNNGYDGKLFIESLDGQGNISGSLQYDPFQGRVFPIYAISGFWDDVQQKISFLLMATPNDPTSVQIYTGYLFQSSSFGADPGPLPDTMTGYYQAFQGTGGGRPVQRIEYGWYGTIFNVVG